MEDAKVVTFNLEPVDIAIVDRASEQLTCPNRSEALRKILREWAYWAEQRRQEERPEALAYPSGAEIERRKA